MPNQQRPILKARLEQLIALVGGLMARYPRTIALFGFCSGVFSFIMVDRQKGFAQVLAIIMLVSWVWLILENLLRETFARRFGWERYATQLIHQESLFFVLPFFLITTTWNSGQALFTGTLAAAALISITDPLYYRWLSRRRWVFLAYHTLTLFAVLLTSLPILLHLTTPESYRLSLGIAVVLSFPSLLVTFPLQHWWRGFLLLGLTLAVGLAGWFGRTWVPPATLWLTEVAVSSQFDDQSRTPGDSLEQVGASQLRSQGLFAYTAINAPRGLDERIYHVWMFNGKEFDRIALDIHGGRKEGYRAWTHKQNFPGDPVGHLVPRGEQQHRGEQALVTQVAQDVQAAAARQADVEHQQVELVGDQRVLRGHAVGHPFHGIAFQAQPGADAVAEQQVVLGQQYSHGSLVSVIPQFPQAQAGLQQEDGDDQPFDPQFAPEVTVFTEAVGGQFVEVLQHFDAVVQGRQAIVHFGLHGQFVVEPAHSAVQLQRRLLQVRLQAGVGHAPECSASYLPVHMFLAPQGGTAR